MNTLEPEGGNKGHREIKITLLANSGNPWDGGIIEHNGKKYPIGRDGSLKLAVNGGEVYANGHTITRIVREQIQQGVSDIVLQHDTMRGALKIQQK